jgi:hypothetical protein
MQIIIVVSRLPGLELNKNVCVGDQEGGGAWHAAADQHQDTRT